MAVWFDGNDRCVGSWFFKFSLFEALRTGHNCLWSRGPPNGLRPRGSRFCSLGGLTLCKLAVTRKYVFSDEVFRQQKTNCPPGRSFKLGLSSDCRRGSAFALSIGSKIGGDRSGICWTHL